MNNRLISDIGYGILAAVIIPIVYHGIFEHKSRRDYRNHNSLTYFHVQEMKRLDNVIGPLPESEKTQNHH